LAAAQENASDQVDEQSQADGLPRNLDCDQEQADAGVLICANVDTAGVDQEMVPGLDSESDQGPLPSRGLESLAAEHDLFEALISKEHAPLSCCGINEQEHSFQSGHLSR
jgi:hypothetical protein